MIFPGEGGKIQSRNRGIISLKRDEAGKKAPTMLKMGVGKREGRRGWHGPPVPPCLVFFIQIFLKGFFCKNNI